LAADVDVSSGQLGGCVLLLLLLLLLLL